MACGRRVLTAVAAFGMVLAVAAAPAGARRGAESGGYEPTHEHGGGAAGGAYTEGGGTGGGTYTEGSGARQGSAPEGSAPEGSAGKDSEGGKKASDLADVCENVFGSEPTGDLTIRTVPPDGATVRPGQEIEVTLTWDAGMLGGPDLHGWANCVTLDDVVVPELSSGESNGTNSGSVTLGYKVPDTAKPGTELCDQAVVVGQDGDLSPQRRGMREEADLEGAFSECNCYTVGRPAPAAAPTLPVVVEEPAAPAPPAPHVLPAVERRPEAAPATLPRTGPSRVLLLLAGVVLLLGGLAVIGGAQAEPLPSRVRQLK